MNKTIHIPINNSKKQTEYLEQYWGFFIQINQMLSQSRKDKLNKINNIFQLRHLTVAKKSWVNKYIIIKASSIFPILSTLYKKKQDCLSLFTS